MLNEYLKEIYKLKWTLLGCGFLLWFGLQRGGGFVIIFYAPFVMALFIQQIIFYFKRNIQRTIFRQTIFWVISLLIVYSHSFYLGSTTRAIANEAVDIIINYKKTNGTYPKSMNEIGLDAEKFRKNHIFYTTINIDPYLHYQEPNLSFAAHVYNFSNHTWDFHAD